MDFRNTEGYVIVFRPTPADGFELAMPSRDADFKRLSQIDGTALKEEWRPIAMRLIREDDGRLLRESDFPWHQSNALVLRERSRVGLRAVWNSEGELLPLACDEVDLVLFNPTRVIPCFDEKESKFERLERSERIFHVYRYSFKEKCLGDACVFRVPHVDWVFVTGAFVDRVRDLGLMGLEFEKVWES